MAIISAADIALKFVPVVGIGVTIVLGRYLIWWFVEKKLGMQRYISPRRRTVNIAGRRYYRRK